MLRTKPGIAARLPRLLLLLGLGTGTALAASSLLRQREGPALPPSAVARVGQRLILRDEWLKAVAAVSSERRTPLTSADQQQILNRLIDEELLVQHGLELGLVEKDQRLRGELVSEVMISTYSANGSATPDEAALRSYYAAHEDRYAGTALLQVSAARLDAAGNARAFEPHIPQTLLTPAKLRSYLGPTLADAALTLPSGSTQTLSDAQGRVSITVEQRVAAEARSFEEMRDEVLADFRRKADEAAVQKLLAELREREVVVLAPTGRP